jgi:ankyrin repeat protein
MRFNIAGFKFGHVPLTGLSPTEQAQQRELGCAARNGRLAGGRDGAQGGASSLPTNASARQAPARPAAHAVDHNSPTSSASAIASQRKNPGFALPRLHTPSDAQLAFREQLKSVSSKRTPYVSKHGEVGIKLNGKVNVVAKADDSQASQLPVWCRHLALEVALHPGKKIDLIKSFSNEEVIRQTFDGRLTEMDIAKRKLVREASPDSKQVVSSENFGRYLKALANALVDGPGGQQGPKEVSSLLLTFNHAMAVQVERKTKAGVNYFAAKVYDPNDTANHKRVEALTPEGLRNIKFSQMLKPGALAAYATEEGKPLWMTAVCLDPNLRPLMNRSRTDGHSAEELEVVLKDGAFNELAAMRQSLRPGELLKLIQALPLGPAETFYNPQQNGHAETVKVFAEIILNADINQTTKLEWLAGKCNGVPGLYMGLQEGHTETVQVFAETVLNSQKLDKKEILELLVAANKGVPGLYQAFEKGNAEAVNAFVRAVLRAERLSKPEKAELLAAKHKGYPGLAVAFDNGHAQTVKAFAETVLKSRSLDETARMALLKAAHDGVPGLMFAFDKGHTEVVKAFANSVLRSNLGNEDKAELLAAKTAAGVSGLYWAVRGGQSETINAFTEIVSNSSLGEPQKAALLAAVSKEARPA